MQISMQQSRTKKQKKTCIFSEDWDLKLLFIGGLKRLKIDIFYSWMKFGTEISVFDFHDVSNSSSETP